MKISICLFALLLIGCVAVPKTKISGTLGGQPFSSEFPKDGDMSGFDVSAETNGTLHLHIDHLSVKMDPDVIQQTASGQVQIINATGDAVAKGVNAAASGMVQGAGKVVAP